LKRPSKENNFDLLPSFQDLEYPKNNNHKKEQKGSKSARRSTVKSIGGDKPSNRNEFSGLK
jgi:hypothetical protein